MKETPWSLYHMRIQQEDIEKNRPSISTVSASTLILEFPASINVTHKWFFISLLVYGILL